MGKPSRMYWPAVGVSRQPNRFIKVDLPEPDGPIIATNSPRRMSQLTPRSAGTSCSPITDVLDRSRTWIIVSISASYGPKGMPPGPPRLLRVVLVVVGVVLGTT